jgi:hypothetical protein
MRYAANCRISGPIAIEAKPDVDLGGVMWSYKVGLMYPPQASLQTPIRPPAVIAPGQPIGKGRSR